MHARDYKEIISGLLLIGLGLFTVLYSSFQYNIGTLARMGPGMFPVMLGGILVALGLLIFLPALRRTGTMPRLNALPAVMILLGTAAFALLIERAGLLPAIVAMTAITVLADEKVTVAKIIALSAVLCVIAYVVFSLGLGVSVPMLRWPL